ncbi:hypothetical protein P152DRAFT_393809 [Eremomyces bilateralis CBS 781.70]|uniref:Zn(2)-C6 fungal-type domain-containing protein n=1 Tax=Eremomyces bilateralis CBS 781.70 TaxID=1392243 RepID=A0A6G1G6I8_9PEZI|nr:uncharacterized protein P152DRAFT_393809 [Eremomyces bilateralis CBS 781.70]KAF1813571.1 hypothetical protein P152DRAFT_393809 [Eremomyces bilateralis CBS 781.70]
MLASDWTSQYHVPDQNSSNPFSSADVQAAFSSGAFSNNPLQTSPVDYMPSSQAQMSSSFTMAPSNDFMQYSTSMAPMNAPAFQMSDFTQELNSIPQYGMPNNNSFINPPSLPNSSPGENWIDDGSLSSRSDNGWQLISAPPSRASFDSFDYPSDVGVSPQALHLSRPRTESSSSDESNVPLSAHSMSSFEEIPFPRNSPESDAVLDYQPQQISAHGFPMVSNDNVSHYHTHSHSHSQLQSAMVSPQPDMVTPSREMVSPLAIQPASSPVSTGSVSPGGTSPSSRRAKGASAPSGVTPKTINKKKTAAQSKADKANDKKLGKRKGPLRPEQRQQAHEIRKVRACLRCKFLKKTCDTGNPCAGCQPSHARLWIVPCTRKDIKEMNYFLDKWNKDYERHITLGFSIANIKGFSNVERLIYVTHGYGHQLPITAREVFVRDESCFSIDWVERGAGDPKKKHHEHELMTNRLSAGMEGVSRAAVSDYLDKYLDEDFEHWVDEYLDGTPFLVEFIKMVYRFWCRTRLPVIRKALKMMVAYSLTCHITLVRGLTAEEAEVGRIEEATSKWQGETISPVMVNFQVKKAMADMWRELMKDVLEELSSSFSSVYSGDKLKNWPTIFLLASMVLAVWEMIQFDMHYRENDEDAIQKFDKEMEEVPVGTLIGLFTAISHQLPSFFDWDTQKHHNAFQSNPAVCEALTEVKHQAAKYETYLRGRNEVAKYDREDFDSLSNKFLSRLVIRAN